MSYAIPPGNKVGLWFTDSASFTPPAGDRVALRFGGLPGTLFAVGTDMSQFGAASVRNNTAQLFAVGWDSSSVSGNLVVTKSLLAVGIPPGSFGAASVYNLNQVVRPFGQDAFGGFGTAWVSLGTRRIYAGLGDQSLFGTAALSGGVRWIDLGNRGIDSLAVPAPTVSYLVRQIFPAWFVATLYGRPAVDYTHNVLPASFGGEQFGQPEVYRPRFIVDLAGLGIAGPEWGDHHVDLHTQYVAPPGWLAGGPTESERFGRAEAYNLTQFVEQLFEVTPDDGGVFGTFTYVDNRNKRIGAEGIQPGKFGAAEIYNSARIIIGAPFVEFTLWGDTLVAPAIRTIEAVGKDTSAWGSPLGNIVYNAARVLAPQGVKPGDVGVPERVWSNQQTIKVVGADQAAYGQAMVAFAVRAVAPYSLPEPPPFGNTTVQLLQRPLAPRGIDGAGFGVPTLEIHFTIIAAKSVLPPANAFGSGRVWNKTPELGAYGWTATEWGGSAVHNQWERYAFDGWDSAVIGKHLIRDRRQTVAPGGIASLAMSSRNEVRKVTPDPPAQQIVSPSGWDTAAVSAAGVRTNVVYAIGDAHGGFGQPILVSNGILARGIPPPYNDSGTQFGVPSFNNTPILRPKSILAPDDPNNSAGSSSLPDVGPRYVWAPRGYPYTTGFWDERGQQMDEAVFGQNHPERPVFGAATVTHRNRTLFSSGDEFLQFGQASLSLNPQYVRPTGVRFQKFGYPVLNGGGALSTYGFDMSRYGVATLVIADYGPKTLRPSGIAASEFGSAEVQNFNRTLGALGWDSFTVSPPATPSWPRTSTWVSNAYAPFPFQGSEHTLFGTAWVSHHTRYVLPTGCLSEVMDYTPGSFKDRMRVSKSRAIGAMAGFDASVFGTATIQNAWSGIRMAGFSDFAFGLVNLRRQNRVHPEGFDALAVGDVQRWEAGIVKAHGDDMAAVGRAVLSRAVGPKGFVGAFGVPGVGRPVRPPGIASPDDQVPAPVAVARWCGNKAMAVGGFDALSMGEVTIT